jgi:hypothetical protein
MPVYGSFSDQGAEIARAEIADELHAIRPGRMPLAAGGGVAGGELVDLLRDLAGHLQR